MTHLSTTHDNSCCACASGVKKNEYQHVRMKMASMGEKGPKKLQSGCAFYKQLDEVLGPRDAIKPERMTFCKSSIIPDKTGTDSSPELSVRPQKWNESPATCTADSQLSTTSTKESAKCRICPWMACNYSRLQ